MSAANLLQACGRRIAERQRATATASAAAPSGGPPTPFPPLLAPSDSDPVTPSLSRPSHVASAFPSSSHSSSDESEAAWGALLSHLADWAGSEPRPLVADAATQV